jgi:tetratricopeptide (TPR) repeat protein
MLEMDSAGEGDFDDAATQAFDRDALLKEAFGGKAPPSMAQMARAPLASPRRALVPPPPAVVPEYIPQEIPEVEEESLEREVAYEAPEEAAPEEPAAPEEAPEEADPEELAEAEFFIEQQLWDEAGEVIGNLRSRIQHYPHLHERLVSLERRLAAARDEGEDTHADAPAGEADGQFDLGAELEKEVDAAPAPEATDDFQYSVEDVLREFKKGVERTVRPEDIETHYDLGIAYREMGLLDEAIGEFDMAAKGATGKPREADCLATIGECLKGKGDLAGAAVVFEKASQIGGVRPETRLNLFFEIGVVREELEDLLAAITAYEKVVALDPKYRDVAERLARLRKKKPPPGSNGAGGAARKVGYL